MTPRKVPLTKIYFLEIDNDIDDEMTIDEAFRIAGEQSSWKADVFQDGNNFKLILTCLEVAGDWLKLAEMLKEHRDIYWRTADQFTPASECDGSDIFIRLTNPLALDDNESDTTENESNTCIYKYLEDVYDDIDWNDLYNDDDKNNTNFVYIVKDNNDKLALLHTEDIIESVEILNEWIDYYYDSLDYSIERLSLGCLLTIRSLDDTLSERLYQEYIKDKIIIEENDDQLP